MTVRNCTTRVRSGCLTCKRRRKKCDEGKPACQNCISTKRICPGYIDPFREVTGISKRGANCIVQPMPSPGRLQLSNETTCHQYIGFRYLSQNIFGCLDQVLIQEVMQRSLSQRAIRHALLALSTDLECFAQHRRVRNFDPVRNMYSLQNYGQALVFIRQILDDELNTETQIEILITMFLIISWELVRGNKPTALIHFEGALHVLAQPIIAAHPLGDNTAVLIALNALFLELEVNALAFVGSRIPNSSILSLESILGPVEDSSIQDQLSKQRQISVAHHSFMCLRYRSFQVMRCPTRKPNSGTLTPYTIQEAKLDMIDKILADLGRWYQLFQPLLETALDVSSELNSPDTKLAKECRILHIHYLLLSMILFNTGENAQETRYDTFGESFEAIVRHADVVLSAKQAHLFTMEMGLIEPLYFTVLKCREPHKRLKALSLLGLCTQEVAWDGPLMTTIAKHVVQVEANLHLCNYLQTSETYNDCSLIDMAESVWEFRDDSRAELYRVSAVALTSDWKDGNVEVEAYYPGGTVTTICAAVPSVTL